MPKLRSHFDQGSLLAQVSLTEVRGGLGLDFYPLHIFRTQHETWFLIYMISSTVSTFDVTP